MAKYLLLALLVAMRLYAAKYMIIADCDESFNYWEPLNFLLRGFGKQTWEYSPEYAIRSYSYLWPYYLVAKALPSTSSGIDVFYFLRFTLLCGTTAFTEYRLYSSVSRAWGTKTANWFLFYTSVALGMQHASVALLPSSFAMNWVTLATSSAIDAMKPAQNIPKFTAAAALIQFAIAGIVGWPFALALAGPFGIYISGYGLRFDPKWLLQTVTIVIAAVSAICAVVIAIDTHYYQKSAFVPLNIVLYNVFGGEGEGPEIFGVEDFLYYPMNLILNFNGIFPLAVLGTVFVPFVVGKSGLVTVSMPLFVWGLVFGSQPHKEERFLYPIYTLISLSGAVFTNAVFQMCRQFGITKILIKFTQWSLVAIIGLVSILRTFSLVENYSAPLSVYAGLSQLNYIGLVSDGLQSKEPINVCTGREWYHFPTSFFLPENHRLRFVTSGFDGLLPGDFLEEIDVTVATLTIPAHMNNKNVFEHDKVIAFEECDYYVDNSLEADMEKGEYKIVDATKRVADGWELVTCEKMIKADGKSGLGRLLYIPEFLRPFVPYNVDSMNFCLMRRKDEETK